MEKLKSWFRKIFNVEGGKIVLDVKRLGIWILVSTAITLMGYISYFALGFGAAEDTSRISKSSKSVNDGNQEPTGSTQSANSGSLGGISDAGANADDVRPARSARPKIAVNYKAKQVLVSGHAGVSSLFPTGTNLVGKLLSSIDTRSNQRVKAILPFASKSKRGDGEFPSGTVFFGSASYSGSGDKVFVKFDQGVLPSGEEFNIHAQALSSDDFSAGIKGEHHGNFGGRTAAILGLSMVSGVSEVLVEKEALGQGFNVTPKASVKNGLYNGVARIADMEINRQAQKVGQKPDYVTIEAGKVIIISLTGSFKGKNE